MPILVTCPGCGARLRVSDSAAGSTVKCPKCKYVIIISTADREDDEPDVPPRPVAKPTGRVRRYDDEFPEEPRPPARRRRRPPPEKKRGWWLVILVVSVGILFGFCVIGTMALGVLVESNERALVGKWVTDPQHAKTAPAEFQNLQIEFLDGGDDCVIFQNGAKWDSSWGADPNPNEIEGWVDLPNPRGDGRHMLIRGIDRDHIELTDELNPQMKVRMKRVTALDRPAGK
jgi:predicted Zn finger-like uncharacterized protein